MITLHRIEAENFRALGHAVFEPLVDGGMTAVNGPNGAGKSSLLTALLWAVYGVTPDGVPQTAMRRQGTTDPVRVLVEFEHDQQTVTVERGLKGRNDSTYMRVAVNGVEQAFGKIRACEAWLVALLGGLDAEGFMTAFVIRQKELDGLVKAKPAERRKLIERLAGIDRMSTAVKSAREEETEVRKRLELLPGDPEALRAAKEALETAQNDAASYWETYEQATAVSSAAREAAAVADEAAAQVQARIDAHREASERLTAAQHALALAEQRETAATRELATVAEAAAGGSDEDVAEATRHHAAAVAALQANQQARAGADQAVAAERADTARAQQARARANAARQTADDAARRADAAEQHAAEFPNTLDSDADRAESDLVEATQMVGSLRGEHDRLTASIRAMEATSNEASHCPTCAGALSDPAAVLDSLRTARQRVEADGRAAAGRQKELEQQIRDLRAQAAAATTAQGTARHLREQAASEDRAAATFETDARAAEETAQASQRAAEAAKEQALSAAQQTHALTEAQEQAAELLRRAQVAAAAADRVPALTTARDQATADVAAQRAALADAEGTEATARVAADERDTIFESQRELRTALAVAERDETEAHGNFRVSEEQVKAAEKTRDVEDLRIRARAEAYELLEQKTAVREALDLFRKDRIASLAPELSEIATDQIAKMTDGKFVAVELDEEFTPVVTDVHGAQRPATWLSGGEESAVALALRLAIGEVIAGSKGGLLWMDEPQTAMDAQRRPAMMSVIRELPGRQPILISHVTEATDMVDLVLEVVPDPDAGSSVILSAVASVADEAMLDTIDA